MNVKKLFSTQLKEWLQSSKPNTVDELEAVFAERSFAIVYVILMALPALPIPTGGITHVLEVICMLVAIEQAIGLKTVWLPKKYRSKPLPEFIVKKALPTLISTIKKVELHSKRRGSGILQSSWFGRMSGVAIFGGALAALLAPPFSGLDTFPALGVVLMALGIIIGDMVYFAIGVASTIFGILLELTVGVALFEAIRRFVVHGNVQVRIIALVIAVLLVIILVARERKK